MSFPNPYQSPNPYHTHPQGPTRAIPLQSWKSFSNSKVAKPEKSPETEKRERESERWRRRWSETSQEWRAWRTCRFSKTVRRRVGSLLPDTLVGSPIRVPAPSPSSSLPSVPFPGACTRSARATRSEGQFLHPSLFIFWYLMICAQIVRYLFDMSYRNADDRWVFPIWLKFVAVICAFD